MKMPAAGKFDVAFLLKQPPIIHCFSTEVAEAPAEENYTSLRVTPAAASKVSQTGARNPR
ncbi:hypothetical protein ACVWZT_004396 [Pseudomonas sp. TE21394]